MDNIIINLDDSLRLGGDPLPNIASQSDIISQSDTIVGPQGPAGPAGPAGRDGEAATITVGSTTTGAAGTNALVQNSGTSSAAILDFTIPRGDRGETGATGATGATGPAGRDGEAATISVGSVTTVSSEYPATVTNSGTSSAAVLDFQIPQGYKGDTGDTGPAGRDGEAATITVGSTTTGAAGTNASVTNSGTSSAAVLEFTIPRGDKGETPTFSYATIFADDYNLTNGAYVAVPLNSNKSTNDNGKSIISGNFTYDTTNKCIVVGSGISAVEVSGEFSIEGGNVGTNVWGVISLNNTNASYRITSTCSATTGTLTQYYFAPAIVSVNQGDKIRLLAYTSGNNIKIRGATAQSYLTIKQVS